MGKTEPLEPGERQQRRVGHPLLELPEARLDVAAIGDDLEIGPEPADERLTAQRRRADHRPFRQIVERPVFQRQKGIAHVLARQEVVEDQPVRQHGRHILGGMHGKIEIAPLQTGLDLLGEQPLAADLGQRTILDAIAGRRDGDDLDIRQSLAPGGFETGLDLVRLSESQRAAARAETDRF